MLTLQFVIEFYVSLVMSDVCITFPHIVLSSAQVHPPPCTVEGTAAASTPDSGQSSPPNGLPSRSSSGSTPIHEEGGGSPYGGAGGQGSCSDLTLYQSPSLPNISLGRPPHSTQPVSIFIFL